MTGTTAKRRQPLKENNQYVGKAGHLAAMAEFAWRGYNVAIPEIDRGDDVFVVRDDTGSMWRLQVKTAKETSQKKSKKFQFRIREASIQTAQTPDLHFVFVMRFDGCWRFLVMHRAALQSFINQGAGTFVSNGASRRIDIKLTGDGGASCAGFDWQSHLEDWSAWPDRRVAPT